MKHLIKSYWFLAMALICLSCERDSIVSGNTSPTPIPEKEPEVVNLLTDISPTTEDGAINAVIEIPAGSIEKWEVNKTSGQLEWTTENGQPRLIHYLGYPGNYGMIPQTLLPKEQGGDGDPLDILVLGPGVERGSTVACKLIGVLYLLDRGEQDDKLIAVSSDSPLYDVTNINDLKEQYPELLEIVEQWFTHYKGPGKMVSKGYGNVTNAQNILQAAMEAYQVSKKP